MQMVLTVGHWDNFFLPVKKVKPKQNQNKLEKVDKDKYNLSL